LSAQEIHPGDLKGAVVKYINRLLDPIRKTWSENKELQELAAEAYPDPNAKKKNNKKSKDKKNCNKQPKEKVPVPESAN